MSNRNPLGLKEETNPDAKAFMKLAIVLIHLSFFSRLPSGKIRVFRIHQELSRPKRIYIEESI